MSILSFYHDVLLVLHLVGLAAGMGIGFANMFIARWAREAQSEETAAVLMSLAPRLSQISTIGLVVLVVTGPLLLFTISGVSGYAFGQFWFYVKLLGVAAMIAIAYLVYQAQQQIRRGETPQYGQYLPMVGPAMGGLALIVTLVSAMVFH